MTIDIQGDDGICCYASFSSFYSSDRICHAKSGWLLATSGCRLTGPTITLLDMPNPLPSVRAELLKYFSPSILFGENNELWLIVCLDNSVSYRFFLLLFYLSIKKTMAKMCLDNDPVACSIIIESHSNGWSIGKLTFLNCVINPNQPGTAAACRHDVVSLMHFSIIRFSSAVIQGRQTE